MVIGLCPKGIRQSRNVNVSKLRFAYGGWPPVGLAATDIPFCDGLSRETAHFGPNPGREPFGAKFWQFGGFRAAIKTAFLNYWETARFGPNPGREPFGARFWQFAGFQAAIKSAF